MPDQIDPAFALRPIETGDDAAMARVVREVMTEYRCTAEGFAIHDPELQSMTAAYAPKGHRFDVVEHRGCVVGGAGYGPLEGGDGTVAELRKMYFMPVARGKGLADRLLHSLLLGMRADGYRSCYLETTSWMAAAQKLYRKAGFQALNGPMGETGHHACDAFFTKDLWTSPTDATGR